MAELRWLTRTWCVLGLLVLGADFVSGPLERLSTLELAGILGLLALTVAGAVAGLLLGMRTPPEMLYAQIFDRAPGPPEIGLEPEGATAARAGWAAIGVAVGLAVGALVLVALTLVFLGTPANSVSDRLPAATGLVTAGWLLACAASASQLGRWFRAWERRRRRILLCRPLSSGSLAPVYYSTPAPDMGGAPDT